MLKDVWMNYPRYEQRAKKQGSINRNRFKLSDMKNLFQKIIEKSIPEFSQEVKLKLPKLNKSNNSELPKVKLPKLKKVETNQVGV